MKKPGSPPDTTAVPSKPRTRSAVPRDRLAHPSDGLALMGEYKGEQNGYDPYDTSRGRLWDAWGVERKRT